MRSNLIRTPPECMYSVFGLFYFIITKSSLNVENDLTIFSKPCNFLVNKYYTQKFLTTKTIQNKYFRLIQIGLQTLYIRLIVSIQIQIFSDFFLLLKVYKE